MTPSERNYNSMEAGALNAVGDPERLAAALLVKTGQMFTLGLPIFSPEGDPVAPQSPKPLHIRYQDWADYLAKTCVPQDGVAYVNDGFLLG